MIEIYLYKMYVCENATEPTIEMMQDTIRSGFVLTKNVPADDLDSIKKYIQSNSIVREDLSRTLFTAHDLKVMTQEDKIIKQILHYFSMGNYGKYKFEIGDHPISISSIRVVDKSELQLAIERDIYSDKPLAMEKVRGIYDLIKTYKIHVKFDQIKNREFKSYLIANVDKKIEGLTGDEVLRAIYIKAQLDLDEPEVETTLIKSPEAKYVLIDSKDNKRIAKMLEDYKEELATVFNRHKDLIMCLKSSLNKKTINKISKLSKKLHKPVGIPFNQTVIDKYVFKGEDFIEDDIESLTTVDIFKILYALSERKLKLPTRTFLIRNGKVHTEENKQILEFDKYKEKMENLEYNLTRVLSGRLQHLNGMRIKYPTHVDYALPISEKKSCGNVPFGTLIRRNNPTKCLTVGMYWKNEWGAYDLDLSSIDLKGNRVGWGMASTYEKGVIFSGDITNAPDGAIECMANPNKEPVILINNIFNGDNGASFKIVVGEYHTEDIDLDTLMLEDTLFNFDYKFQGNKQSCVLGALTDNEFILYPANLGSKRVSGNLDNAMLQYMVAPRLRMRYLLENIAGATLVDVGPCDVDLSLSKVTFGMLQALLTKL